MKRLPGHFLLVACCLWAAGVHAAFSGFLKLDGVTGGSTDTNHLKWIEIESLSEGAEVNSNKLSFSELCIQKVADKSSPVLAQSCADRHLFPTATLELITADASGVLFYQITLSNVFVSSFSTSAGSGEHPQESLCLNFERIAWTYTQLGTRDTPIGDVSGWWNLALDLGNASPEFRVGAVQTTPGSLGLSWTAQAGKSYNILTSPALDGRYGVYETFTPTNDGPMSVSVPITVGSRFYRVEEAP